MWLAANLTYWAIKYLYDYCKVRYSKKVRNYKCWLKDKKITQKSVEHGKRDRSYRTIQLWSIQASSGLFQFQSRLLQTSSLLDLSNPFLNILYLKTCTWKPSWPLTTFKNEVIFSSLVLLRFGTTAANWPYHLNHFSQSTGTFSEIGPVFFHRGVYLRYFLFWLGEFLIICTVLVQCKHRPCDCLYCISFSLVSNVSLLLQNQERRATLFAKCNKTKDRSLRSCSGATFMWEFLTFFLPFTGISVHTCAWQCVRIVYRWNTLRVWIKTLQKKKSN